MSALNRSSSRDDHNLFQQIFLEHWDSFKEYCPSYDCSQYNEAVSKMLGCGNESGGYSDYQCFHCGLGFRRVCFSCKSLFCLSCSGNYAEGVISSVSRSLHPNVVYRHLVLTIPEQLRIWFFQERFDGKLLSSFMKLGHDFIEEAISVSKRKDLKIGSIVVVQTHGRSGTYNPHLHLIVSDGGINPVNESWQSLGYIDYKMLHRKWQYFLLKWVKSYFGREIYGLVEILWKDYPEGFVANVSKGSVPDKCRGLARYLAKYVASPPISVKRILSYNGVEVKYWYNDHKSKGKKIETVSVLTFIGRMVQHIMPKSFQRIRYYGLQATKTFKKWQHVIDLAFRKIKSIAKGAYQIFKKQSYRARYQEISLFDPFRCQECGSLMDLSRIYTPTHGAVFEIWDHLHEVRNDTKTSDVGVRYSLGSTIPTQLSLF